MQAEDRAPVKDQVELHVAAAAVELELAFPLAIGGVLPLLSDRQIAGQECVAAGAGQIEELLPALRNGSDALTGRRRGAVGGLALVEDAPGILVVVEDPADTAGFIPVLQIEVLVAPGLEDLVVGRVDAVAGVLEGPVEVLGVFQEGVVRG